MINATVIRIGPCEVNAKLTLKENKTNDVKQNSKTDGVGTQVKSVCTEANPDKLCLSMANANREAKIPAGC